MNKEAAFDPNARPEGLNDHLLAEVIAEFYRRVMADAELGPVFKDIIGRRWDSHILRIMSFWRTATRLGNGYPGKAFMPAHLKHHRIQASQLPRWLELFRSACNDLCQPAEAAYLIDIAERMAENLAISLARRDES